MSQAKWGNSWKNIAKVLPGRSVSAVGSRWNNFDSRPDVARHSSLLDALPKKKTAKVGNGQRLTTKTPKGDAKEAIEGLASYLVDCGGKKLIDGWYLYPYGATWHYHSKEGKRFGTRPGIARHFKLPGAPRKKRRKRSIF